MNQSILSNELANVASTKLDLTLPDILKVFPKEIFYKNKIKAWTQVIVNVLIVTLGYIALAISPWYLVPFLWLIVGTGLAGFFVIGHDCGHRSFADRKWVNNLVGHIMTVPLIYPFHAWRVLHNHHHKYTNNLDLDNTWNPFKVEYYDQLNKLPKWSYRIVRGYIWGVGSIAHWATLHLSWQNFEGKEREQVKLSVLLCLAFAVIAFPTLIVTTGLWGFVKFWLIPWLIFHFWVSTFTIVHHTSLDIPFSPNTKWNEAEAQLMGTVHCKYPFWVEFLCHDINVHIPHHLSRSIPSYNLRKAYAIIKENWGDRCQESVFSWALMKEITQDCNLYCPINNYQSF